MMQKIIAVMLCEQALGIPLDEREIDPAFVRKVLVTGHFWAFEWEDYDNFERTISTDVANEVADILHMWGLLGYSHSELSDEDKEYVRSEIGFWKAVLAFPALTGMARRSTFLLHSLWLMN